MEKTSPADIDEQRVCLHPLESGAPEKPGGFRRSGKASDEQICFRQQGIQFADRMNLVKSIRTFRPFSDSDGICAKRFQTPGDRPSEITGPQNQSIFSVNGLVCILLFP